MTEQAGKTAVVLGAGMVGISTAIHLVKRGWQVTLIDKKGPGAETSFGNAGVISRGSILPVSYPGVIKDLPKILMGRSKGVRVDPSAWLEMFGWAPAWLRNSSEARNRELAGYLDALLAKGLAEHEALMEEAGATAHLTKSGWLKVYRSEESFQNTRFEREQMDRFGIEYTVLDAAGIAELEPNLRPIYVRGIHVLGTANVDDPGAVCKAYANLFNKLGGVFEARSATSLKEGSDGVRISFQEGADITVDSVVVAMGAWSSKILETVGVKMPLFRERGYHRHYRAKGNAVLNRPVYDAGGAFVLAPMAAGIRLTIGVEIAATDAPPSAKMMDKVSPGAHEAFPLAESLDAEPWFGRRPSLPDSLPAIGRAPGLNNIWTSFGHQHIGFTLGPVSGRVLAEMMSGEAPLVDPSPYDPARFG